MRVREAVEKFEKDLTHAGAELIIQSVSAELLLVIAKADPSVVQSWYRRFIDMDAIALKKLHNIALLVARIISDGDPKSAIALFDKLKAGSPLVRVTVGGGGISLDAISIWGSADSDELNKLRIKRLDEAPTDHEIAIEVLAAMHVGKQNQLREYVLDRRGRPEPSYVARAATVAAFSDESDWALQTIEGLKGSYGFLSHAYDAAKYAMDRHIWAKHWATQMRESTAETDLWRYGILLAEIVDGRFNGSSVSGTADGRPIERYGTTFNDLIRRRINRWKDKRSKTLVGLKAPDELLLG